MKQQQTTVIGILPKSPYSQGRIGPSSLQDWHRSCAAAARLRKKMGDAEIITSSATHIAGADPDENYYVKTMTGRFKCPIKALGKGTETLSQLEAFQRYADGDDAQLVVLASWSHWTRVVWMCWRHDIDASVRPVFGIPRPLELVTDTILAIVHPIIDMCGQEDWLMSKFRARRAEGKLLC